MNNNISDTPIWRNAYTHVKLPEELLSLKVIAKNLWWVWNSEAYQLFEEIDRDLWFETKNNPIKMLQSLSHQRIKEILNDRELLVKIEKVRSLFDIYMSRPLDAEKASVAYFSMEYGMTHILKIYSGGLGVLAGDYLKEASDSGIDLCAVGLLYRYGYFSQSISPEGHQIANLDSQVFSELPIDQVVDQDSIPIVLAVPYPDRQVYANIWKVSVGRVSLYLLDTDTDLNSDYDRSITHQLYGGDWENRIKQEVLLGIGGILLLNKLGIEKRVYHCNEGHAAFINIQRLLNLIEKENLPFKQALEIVRSSSLYTVHTPVPAGHDYFEEKLVRKYFNIYPERLGITWQEFVDMGRENPGTNDKFSMSAFALNTCQETNGVSYLHGIVSKEMFEPMWKGYFAQENHVGYVTNGVHMPTWTSDEMKALYNKYFEDSWCDNQSNFTIWKAIKNVPDEEIWKTRLALKTKLVNYIQKDMAANLKNSQQSPSNIVDFATKLNPNALIVGFGRRFATYKRAHLLFTDLERLAELVNNKDRPIQFIFAGKAHPADGAGQGLIKRIIDISRKPEFVGKIIFLENYDMLLAKYLIAGVDIWLNTPTRPLEASGTSGQKAVMNGVLNFSVLDGWWYEGYKENAGWMLTDKRTYLNQEYQDELDALTIYYTFEKKILPIYYAQNTKGYSQEWIQFIKNSISEIAPQFTMKRMLDDYIRKYYTDLSKWSKILIANNYAKSKELVAWKENTLSEWNNIEIVSAVFTGDLLISKQGQITFKEGDILSGDIVIDKKNILGELGLECVISRLDIDTQKYNYVRSYEFALTKTEGSKLYFRLETIAEHTGMLSYAFRLFPKHPLMKNRMGFPLVRWL